MQAHDPKTGWVAQLPSICTVCQHHAQDRRFVDTELTYWPPDGAMMGPRDGAVYLCEQCVSSAVHALTGRSLPEIEGHVAEVEAKLAAAEERLRLVDEGEESIAEMVKRICETRTWNKPGRKPGVRETQF